MHDRRLVGRLEALHRTGGTSEAALRQARRNLSASVNAAHRAERTLKLWMVPGEEIQAVKEEARRIRARKGARDTGKDSQHGRVEVRAPGDGTIVERNVSRGEMIVDGTMTLFQIARFDKLKVLVPVPEEDLPVLEAVKPEQRRWTIRPGAATAVEGRLVIGAVIDPIRHTAGGWTRR